MPADELWTGEPTGQLAYSSPCHVSGPGVGQKAGYPPEKILYYRGGLHDWLTLGLPVVPGEGDT